MRLTAWVAMFATALVPRVVLAADADAGTVPVLRVELRADSMSGTDGGTALTSTESAFDGGTTLVLELPPSVPVDTAFELRTWVPAEVTAVTAEYWRAGEDCAVASQAGEPRLPLKTVLREVSGPVDPADAGFVQHGSELVISVPELSQPWWSHCFEVSLWMQSPSQALGGSKVAALLRELSNTLDETGKAGVVEIREAAVRAAIFQDCAREHSEWSKRYACESALNTAATGFLGNRHLLAVSAAGVELRSKVKNLRKAAGRLGEVLPALPSYEDFLTWYAREATTEAESRLQTRAEAQDDFGVRAETLKHDLKVLSSFHEARSSTSNLKQVRLVDFGTVERLAAAESDPTTKKRDLSVQEAAVDRAANEFRTGWHRELEEAIAKERTRIVAEDKALTNEAAALTAELAGLEKVRLGIGEDVAAARKQRDAELGRILKRLGEIAELEAVVTRCAAKVKKAREQNASQKEIAALEKELAEAQLARDRASPASVKAEHERISASYAELEKWLERDLPTLKAQVDLKTARSNQIAIARAALTVRGDALELVEATAGDVSEAASAYDDSFRTAVSALRAATLSVVKPRGSAHSKPASSHVERAWGFFSTDIGMGAVAPPIGELQPIAFAQLSFSLGRVSFDHGLGSSTEPAGTGTGTWLAWVLGQRVSFNAGLSMNLRPIRTQDGQLHGLFGQNTPMGTLSMGVRVNEFLKINAGSVFGTTQPDIPGMGARIHPMWFLGGSLDLPVYKAVGKVISPLFPTTNFATVEPRQ